MTRVCDAGVSASTFECKKCVPREDKKKKKMYTCASVCVQLQVQKRGKINRSEHLLLCMCVRTCPRVWGVLGSKRTAVHILQVGSTWPWTAGSPIKQRVKESEHTGHYELQQ